MPNTLYENFVLENKLQSILATKIDMNNYLTVDYSLTENAGNKKIIHKYAASGNVQDLAMGVGNSEDIVASFTSAEYTVGTTQGRGVFYDEEANQDPMVVDTLLNGLAETMVNDFTTKAIDEMKKADLIVECDFSTSSDGYFFNKVVDALAIVGEIAGEDDGSEYSLLISPSQQAYIRKQLRDDLKYSEGYSRTGYIGSVAGIPVVVSKAVPNNCAFIANKEATTLFLKRDTEVEQDRDPNTRKNSLFIRKMAVVALTNAKKIVALAKAQTTACAITSYTKAQKTISGTCGTDCHKVVVVDGDGEVYTATPSAGAWSVTAKENLTAGDKINATAYAYGYAPKAATEVTVAS